jgi:hypothetical protein
MDVASVVDFVGEAEYRLALDELGRSLRAKGGITPYDDLAFSLELDLFNLEILRKRCGGSFKSYPRECHNGVDFLLGLGQTIPALSESGKTRLLGRLRKGFKEGLWPLQHELRVSANLSRRGCDLYFHDLEEDGGYDFLATHRGAAFEIEAKAVSVFTGWPIPLARRFRSSEVEHGVILAALATVKSTSGKAIAVIPG